MGHSTSNHCKFTYSRPHSLTAPRFLMLSYTACHFFRKEDRRAVYSASQVRLVGNQAFATISDLL